MGFAIFPTFVKCQAGNVNLSPSLATKLVAMTTSLETEVHQIFSHSNISIVDVNATIRVAIFSPLSSERATLKNKLSSKT